MTEIKYNFQKVAKRGSTLGVNLGDPYAAQRWFRDQASAVNKMSVPKFKDSAGAFQNLQNLSPNSIGKMYSFVYDPKWKETLPYYDTFPLVFPIDFKGDSMLGLNMHYLSPFMRAKLLDALYVTLNNDKYNKTSQLKISYDILNGASQFKAFRPCLKKYLFSHVQSAFHYIPPPEWDYVLCLPLARFKKKSQEFVWFESNQKT